MKRLIWAGLIVLGVLFGGMAWIRFAPDDPARWNLLRDSPLADVGLAEIGPDINAISEEEGGARALRFDTRADPAALLACLDAVALVTPRTRRLAGSIAEGRITWITRSAIFGFPDYTTAEVRQEKDATRLEIHARSRYGKSDLGVNVARVTEWLDGLAKCPAGQAG